jgi:Uma2 family endonuclease
MDTVVKELFQSPKLALYIEEINEAWTDEQRRRMEFLEKITEDDKAEFINGEAIFHSPARDCHNLATMLLCHLLNTYVMKHDLGEVRTEKAMVSLRRNEYEPDVCFFGPEKSEKIQEGTLRYPAPDFVVEVLSPSTEANDRGVKLEDYAYHGIEEYWIIDPEKKTLEQYLLAGERYELAVKLNNGVVQSRVIPGFEIPVRAVFDKAEFQAAQRKLAS